MIEEDLKLVWNQCVSFSAELAEMFQDALGENEWVLEREDRPELRHRVVVDEDMGSSANMAGNMRRRTKTRFLWSLVAVTASMVIIALSSRRLSASFLAGAVVVLVVGLEWLRYLMKESFERVWLARQDDKSNRWRRRY